MKNDMKITREVLYIQKAEEKTVKVGDALPEVLVLFQVVQAAVVELVITLMPILTVDEEEEVGKIQSVQQVTGMEMEVNLEAELAVVAQGLMEDRYLLLARVLAMLMELTAELMVAEAESEAAAEVAMDQAVQMLNTKEMVNLRTTKVETQWLEARITEMAA